MSFLGSAVGALGQGVQGLAGAFTAQNKYQGQLAPTSNTDYANYISQAGQNQQAGYGQFLQNQAQQGQLAGRLQDMAAGKGPNPAMNQLNQTTGQNTANTAALMASARGSNTNPALMARQAGTMGAANQQNAAGQAATMAAQQQLGAQSQLAGLYGQMGSQIQGEQGQNTGMFGQATGAQNQQNANNVANYGMMQGINSQVAQNNANAVNKTTGSLLNAAGQGAMMLAKGGEVSDDQTEALGGMNQKSKTAPLIDGTNAYGSIHSQYAPDISNANSLGASGSMGLDASQKKGPKSMSGQQLAGAPAGLDSGSVTTPMNQIMQPGAMPMMVAAHGGMVPALVSPGEKYLNPNEAEAVAKGNTSPDKVGKKIPGQAKVKGDSYKNDTVKAKLEEGGCVIPRSVMETKDVGQAIKFVRAHMRQSLKKA